MPTRLQGSANDPPPRVSCHLTCDKRRPHQAKARTNCRQVQHVIILATVDTADVAEALDLAWRAFRKVAGEDLAGWDLASAAAEVRPAAPLGTVRPLRGDQRGDNAPQEGDAAAELAQSRRGADDDTEPASADVPAAGGHVNA